VTKIIGQEIVPGLDVMLAIVSDINEHPMIVNMYLKTYLSMIRRLNLINAVTPTLLPLLMMIISLTILKVDILHVRTTLL
jgi:hypothetical protein